MFARHIFFGVLVAAIASVRRIVGGMAHFAIRLFAFVAMIEREGMFDEARWCPSRNGMARSAIGSKLTAMY